MNGPDPSSLPPQEQAILRSIKEPLTYFAAERTLLMWVRTGGGLIGLGFIIDRFGLFLRMVAAQGNAIPAFHLRLSFWFGAGFVVLGAVVNALAAARYYRFHRQFRRGDTSPGKGVLAGVVLGLLLAAAGVGLAVYLYFVD